MNTTIGKYLFFIASFAFWMFNFPLDKIVLKLLFNYECYIVLHHGGNTYEKDE